MSQFLGFEILKMNVFHVSCRGFRSIAQLCAGLLCAYLVLHTLYVVVVSRQRAQTNPAAKNLDEIPAKLKFSNLDLNGQVQVVVSFDAKDLSKIWDGEVKKKFSVLDAVELKGVPPEITIVMQNSHLCANLTDLEWLVLIKSSPESRNRRRMLRDTWADVKLFRKDLFRVVFAVGETADEAVKQAMKVEFEKHGDILQGDFLDSEKNASLKIIMGLKWATDHCPKARYVVKANDNTFMNIFEMMRAMETSRDRGRALICPLWQDNTMPILRDPSECGLWCVRDDELPGRKYFPQYCAGMGFIMSREVAVDLCEAAKVTPLFWIDDVYITGLVTQHVKQEIHYVDVLSHFSLKEDLVFDEYVNNRTITITISMITDDDIYRKIWRATIRRLQPTQFKLLSDKAIARHM